MNSQDRKQRKRLAQRKNANGNVARGFYGERGLRVTHKYFAQQAAQRKAWASGFYRENARAERVAVLNVTESREKGTANNDKFAIKKMKWKLTDIESVEAEILHQDNPDDVCLYEKYRGQRRYSPTANRKSRQNWAWKKR